ncbi:DUF1178 family protein [Roseovarius pacificus]|uniref:DUF1178 family protein n=1 Tax=Roseovarius pacificus TaxID=337701 RepID=UPI00403A6908
MIQFSLKCDRGHRFDSWFQSSAAFEKLQAAGMISCAVCGSTQVEKGIMAPRVADSRSKADKTEQPPEQDRPLSAPANPAEQALAEMRKQIEKNSEYVGANFASEARRMHSGESPERSIHGEARPDEARKLIEDGVPITPLPFMPGRKSN